MELSRATFEGLEAGPHLVITGGVHGDEFEPIVAIRELIRSFSESRCEDTRSRDEDTGSRCEDTGSRCEDTGSSPSATRLECGRLTLVPVVNVEAFERGSRTAADGLDLARTCPGRAKGSWTHQVARELSRLIRNADYYIDLHSGGTNFTVMPLAGYMLHANPQVLDRQREMARAFGLPIVWGTSAELQGRSLSVARDAGVPAIYAEYLGGGTCSLAGVEAYREGCLRVMALLGMVARLKGRALEARKGRARAERQRVVEDPRPHSGHMQISNPSPATGIFLPAVKLGDEIRTGDPLGRVLDTLGSVAHDVLAKQTGTVLVLRTYSRVLAGESVGVILEAP